MGKNDTIHSGELGNDDGAILHNGNTIACLYSSSKQLREVEVVEVVIVLEVVVKGVVVAEIVAVVVVEIEGVVVVVVEIEGSSRNRRSSISSSNYLR